MSHFQESQIKFSISVSTKNAIYYGKSRAYFDDDISKFYTFVEILTAFHPQNKNQGIYNFLAILVRYL